MRLYQHPFSNNAARAVITALELNVPVELVLVDLPKREQRRPAFLALNPAGRVPVLEDDGLVLTESHAIMLYFADNTPGQTLYPADIRTRCQVNRWMFWCAAHFQPATSVLNWERMVKRVALLGEPDPAEIARGERLVLETAGLLDSHLAGREWVVGDHMTLADISLATPLLSTQRAGLPVLQFEHLQRWYERMRGLRSWQKACGVPTP
jgi:glutathione S-transferase